MLSSGLNLLGWVGGGLVAAAYVMVSTQRIAPDAALFQGLNMVGAALLCVACFNSGALPSACMNIAWILFGVHSLAMASRRRRRAASALPRAGREVVRQAEPAPTEPKLVDVVLGAA